MDVRPEKIRTAVPFCFKFAFFGERSIGDGEGEDKGEDEDEDKDNDKGNCKR